jgi:hypothetical protein
MFQLKKDKTDLQTKITKLEKDKEKLQTKYDMEVRTKEELIGFLNVYREQNNYLQYNENDKVGLKEFLDQHSSKNLNFLFIRLNKSKVIDFNLIKTVMFSYCSILKIVRQEGELVLNNLAKRYKQSIDFYQNSFTEGEHLLLCNLDKTKVNYAED